MTHVRKGGVWGDHTRAGQPWTDQEDEQLIAWGLAVGHDFVAGHDFGREPREGTERIAWLREHRASLVRHVEAETMSAAEDDEPRDMPSKPGRARMRTCASRSAATEVITTCRGGIRLNGRAGG